MKPLNIIPAGVNIGIIAKRKIFFMISALLIITSSCPESASGCPASALGE